MKTTILLAICAGLCCFLAPVLAEPAPALNWQAGKTGQGIHLLDGGDGRVAQSRQGDAPCVAPNGKSTHPGRYLYFNVNAAAAAAIHGPLYVRIEYFDADFQLGAVRLEYDSDCGDALADKYHPADAQAGGRLFGTGRWKQGVFELAHPRLQHRQNLGADFRFSGPILFLRRVEILTAKPADWEALDAAGPDLPSLVRIGPGGELIVGGFDPPSREEAPRQARALEAALPALKALGMTSHEGYVRWNLCEPRQGEYDWSVYDRCVALYKKFGVRWVPFLIAGSAYSLPDWYYKSPDWCGYICLEHGQQSDIDSLWNPALRGHVERFIRAFCEHYRDSGVIESILLGVTGNFGEAIYPATEGHGWTAAVHGDYHSHPGFWAGDRHARASFQAWLKRKYQSPARLQAAWGQAPARFDDVQPLLRKAAPNDRAWLDMVDWYVDSMNQWSRFWLTTTRKHFAGGIYLCTGGHAPAEHGADFGMQCRLAAEISGGVRITNEASDEGHNFALTRWVAAAGRQYGAYFSFEPASRVTPEGIVARVYNASTSGAKGLHFYYPNISSSPEALASYRRSAGEFRQRRPLVEVAVFYPTTSIHLGGHRFLPYAQKLRDYFDFDFQSESQIVDGGLARYHALVVLQGNVAEAETWNRIAAWVRAGGLLVVAEGAGPLQSVEGRPALGDLDGARGRMLRLPGKGDAPAFLDALCGALAAAKELDPRARAMIRLDGRPDQVFASLIEPGEIVWLNHSDQTVRKADPALGAPLELPPHAIATQKLSTKDDTASGKPAR